MLPNSSENDLNINLIQRRDSRTDKALASTSTRDFTSALQSVYILALYEYSKVCSILAAIVL